MSGAVVGHRVEIGCGRLSRFWTFTCPSFGSLASHCRAPSSRQNRWPALPIGRCSGSYPLPGTTMKPITADNFGYHFLELGSYEVTNWGATLSPHPTLLIHGMALPAVARQQREGPQGAPLGAWSATAVPAGRLLAAVQVDAGPIERPRVALVWAGGGGSFLGGLGWLSKENWENWPRGNGFEIGKLMTWWNWAGIKKGMQWCVMVGCLRTACIRRHRRCNMAQIEVSKVDKSRSCCAYHHGILEHPSYCILEPERSLFDVCFSNLGELLGPLPHGLQGLKMLGTWVSIPSCFVLRGNPGIRAFWNNS